MTRRTSFAHHMTIALLHADVQSPAELLAIAVLGVAVDDAADGDAVVVDAEWADVAGVDPSLLADHGVRVWEIL